MSLTHIVGILPAIVFPAATLLQLIKIIRRRSAAGIHLGTWVLFGFANIAIYIYAERYTEWQAILGMLVTAVLDFVIVGVAWFVYPRTAATVSTPSRRTPAPRAAEVNRVAKTLASDRPSRLA